MICPNCKCEYIRGVTQCADCGVALVDALESAEANPAEDVRIVPIWQGNDSAECERVQEALENADIPFTVPDPKSSFSFLPTEPTLEVWISDADREKARKILLELVGRVNPDELTPEEIESLALPESDQRDSEERTSQLQDSSDNWDEDDPVTEVWNGDSEGFADSLIVCLREVGVASRKLSEAGHWRLVVRPEQESRAKEIVREVVEASPSE
jgi:Putative prokaryotic signal transducing protein